MSAAITKQHPCPCFLFKINKSGTALDLMTGHRVRLIGSHKTDQWALIMFHFEEYSPKAYFIENLAVARLCAAGHAEHYALSCLTGDSDVSCASPVPVIHMG
jgi:hypothetical protein